MLVLSLKNWIPEQGSRMTEGREADDGGVLGRWPPSAILGIIPSRGSWSVTL